MTKINLSQNPIFILGFPRSGTTLIQTLLITQDHYFSFPETHYFCTILRFIKTDKKGFIKPKCLELVNKNIVFESLMAFKRAGANAIISYYADRLDKIL